ncbi:MAG TPA: 50S ribosomal protein L25 [Armatimonadota bacterium]|nr:50S ribosomal protein L25 [Armatimonadota bacterium]
MTRLQLSSKTRADFRKSETKRLRREGHLPATVYGRGEESKAITVPAADLTQILRTPGGRLSLIDLKVDGKGSKAHPVLIQEIQRDPITNKVLHVNFHRVSMDEPVQASVPIILLGAAPGTKQGGILEQFTRELEVRALPDHIPTHIDVDVSSLELGDAVHVREVSIPEGVGLIGPLGDNVVAVVRMPIVQVEEVVPEVEEEIGAAPEAEAPAEVSEEQ